MDIIHDIIIADFGRPATIRYLKLFSKFEKEIIINNNNIDVFYDEMRRIRYTIIGSLRQIKSNWLPKNDSSICGKHLAGVKKGIDPVELIYPFFKIIIPYIKAALKSGATIVRIIIPCNSLSNVEDFLGEIFSTPEQFINFSKGIENIEDDTIYISEKMKSANIYIPGVVDYVIAELIKQGQKSIDIIGSELSIQAYNYKLEKKSYPFEMRSYCDKNNFDFNKLLQCFVNECQYNLPELKSNSLLSACTDIEIPGAMDSLSIFTNELVKEVYETK